MKIQTIDFLEKLGVNFEVTEHQPAFTAQRLAAAEREPGKYVAKPVIVKADGKLLMCVLCACYKIDFEKLKNQLGADSVELADESEIAEVFGDCEIGAEPPFGNLYNVTTIIDKELAKDDHIAFQGGTHENAIRMSMEDYMRLVLPRILDFSYHMD